MTDKNPGKGCLGILGWSLNAIDAVEAWIHNGKIRFLNMSRARAPGGYSVFVSASPSLETGG